MLLRLKLAVSPSADIDDADSTSALVLSSSFALVKFAAFVPGVNVTTSWGPVCCCCPTVTVEGAIVPVLSWASLNVPVIVYCPVVVGATRVYVKGLLFNWKNCMPPDVVVLNDAVELTNVNPEGIDSVTVHPTGLVGRLELGAIVTLKFAPGATFAGNVLVTLPALGVPTVTVDVAGATVPVLS